VGASDIAATKVLPAIRAVGDTAVVVRSGDLDHAAAWARDNGVPDAVTDLRSALERDDVDAVYVSSVNAQHRAHVEAAAAAGKHVLAEKPLALSLEDAQSMVRACRAAEGCDGDEPPLARLTDPPCDQGRGAGGSRRRCPGGPRPPCGPAAAAVGGVAGGRPGGLAVSCST
jgi:hypothetical protein